MIDRLSICLCHPKKIGLFFKDKLYIPLLYVLGFYIMFVGICALHTFSTDIFNSGYVDNATNLIMNSNSEANTSYNSETKKLTGDYATFANDIYSIHILPKETVVGTNRDLVYLIFEESNATAYYRGFEIGEVSYEGLTISSFTIKDVISGSVESRLVCSGFISYLLSNSETGVSLSFLLDYAVSGLIYFIGIILALYVFSFFNNPSIDKTVRTKLCLYDSLIFFLVLAISIVISESWIFYLALGLPIFYNISTFTHIVRTNRS